MIGDATGVVYVEFLIAVIPIFLLFLSICQLTLVTAARLVVLHAANAAVRSAIVVLEDPVNDYEGAPRGNLSAGDTEHWGWHLPIGVENYGCFTQSGRSATYSSRTGARMSAIRMAAALPLLALAPKENVRSSTNGNVAESLVTSTEAQLGFAYCYTQSATSVTIMQDESSDVLAVEPINPKHPVTVRVAYLYHCGVPIARSFMCRPLSSLVDSKLTSAKKRIGVDQFGNPGALSTLTSSEENYVILTGRATLTNQGADYIPAEQNP